MKNNELELAISTCKWIEKWYNTNGESRTKFEIVDILQAEISEYLDYETIVKEWEEQEHPNKIKKRCKRCGSELIVRVNSKTKTKFLGCSKWPTCKPSEYEKDCYKYRDYRSDNSFWDDCYWDGGYDSIEQF